MLFVLFGCGAPQLQSMLRSVCVAVSIIHETFDNVQEGSLLGTESQ